MLDFIKNLKHRHHPKPKKDKHPWRCHNPGLFKSNNEPYKDYVRESHDKRLKKQMRKGDQDCLLRSVY